MMTKDFMVANYKANAGAHDYIYGFNYKGTVYMTTIMAFIDEVVSYEQASRGQGFGLRCRIRKALRDELLKTAIALGAESELYAGKYNKGENFERLVSQYYGIEWHKDNEAFTNCGDICIGGLEIQIKFDGATFTNEKTLAKVLGL